jgi:hypothetical protein
MRLLVDRSVAVVVGAVAALVGARPRAVAVSSQSSATAEWPSGRFARLDRMLGVAEAVAVVVDVEDVVTLGLVAIPTRCEHQHEQRSHAPSGSLVVRNEESAAGRSRM